MAQIPTELFELLNEYDKKQEPYLECTIGSAIRALRDKQADSGSMAESIALQAESMAFDFVEDYPENTPGWGTYFGPVYVMKNQRGEWVESPSIRLVTAEMLRYWQDRSVSAQHPMLQARYADLVWDFSPLVLKKNAEISCAHTAIDAYQAIINRNLFQYESNAITKLKRSLDLSVSINDKIRIGSVRDAIIAFEDEMIDDVSRGLWGISFDFLVENKKMQLSESQRDKIINDLEESLVKTTCIDNNKVPMPQAVEAVATRLIRHYRRQNKIGDVQRVLRLFGQACIEASKSLAPLVGVSWLQKIYELYCVNGMKNEADKLCGVLTALGHKTVEDMKTFSAEIKIPDEKVDLYLKAMTEGTLFDVLTRIAGLFLPDPDQLENQVANLTKDALIQHLTSQSIFDHEGRTVAKIGSADDDLSGQIVMQLSQNMQLSAGFLRMVIEKLQADLSPTLDDFLDYLFASPVFDPARRKMIAKGLEAYLQGDCLVATHVLVPQIENVLRYLLRLTKGSVYRPGRNGGLFLKNFDEILSDVKDVLGERNVHYLSRTSRANLPLTYF